MDLGGHAPVTAAEPTAEPGRGAGGQPHGGPRPRGPRVGLSLRLGAVVTVLLAVSCVVWGAVSGAAQPEVGAVDDAAAADVPQSRAPGAATDRAAGDTPSAAGPTVHVMGGVAVPGVYHLAAGARTYEAIAAAGGAVPGADVDRLNLAASVEDGSRLRVPLRGEPEETGAEPGRASGAAAGPAGGSGGASGSGPGRRININIAAAEELGTLPRVGPVLAQRIVDYRTAHGRFARTEDLDAVSGIGPKMLESLLPLVTVG